MHSPESEASQKGSLPLICDFDLPVFTEPMREHWPSSISWAEAMRLLGAIPRLLHAALRFSRKAAAGQESSAVPFALNQLGVLDDSRVRTESLSAQPPALRTTLPPEPAFPLLGGVRLRIFLLSFTLLFFELLCIRWIPAYVRYLSYFTNFILLASFLGIGLGSSRRDEVRFAFPLFR